MLTTQMGRRGMVTSPHHLATQAGLAVLREGGNAIEAAIATASTLAVVCPHTSGLGGDGFWLIAEPGKPPISIDGSGAAGSKVGPDFYAAHRQKTIPCRGFLAAGTVSGLVSGWQLALDVSGQWGGGMGLERLFEDAIHYAHAGFAVSDHLSQTIRRDLTALKKVPGFAACFLPRNKAPQTGATLTLPALAQTLERLAHAGLDDFYRGDVGSALAQDLKAAGSPLKAEDLARHRGMRRRPLSLGVPQGMLFNTAPPTQGLASMMMLGLFAHLSIQPDQTADWLHGLIEAAKMAFKVRDAHITDPHSMSIHAATYLSESVLGRLSADLNMGQAAPWTREEREGETAWFGVIDGQGRAVSVIQSLCHAFGSGLTLPATGIVWQDRVSSFSLDPMHRNALEPRRRPLHTLTPALARLKDGRTLVWGGTGGDVQPMVQAQIFGRAILRGEPLQAALTAPRLALGGAGEIRAESRFAPDIMQSLTDRGHPVTVLDAFEPRLGQAGALLRRPDGLIEGACDPRSDGSVAGW